MPESADPHDGPRDDRLLVEEVFDQPLEPQFRQRIDEDGRVWQLEAGEWSTLGTVPSHELEDLRARVESIDLLGMEVPMPRGTIVGGTDTTWTLRRADGSVVRRTFESHHTGRSELLDELELAFADCVGAAVEQEAGWYEEPPDSPDG